MSRRLATSLAAGLLAAGCLSILAAGCGKSAEASLADTSWRLSAWSLSSLDPAGFTITARFAGGQISGNSGVNSYSGPYKAGPGHDFHAGPLASTQMAGPEPAMRAETAYLTLLGQARSYEATNETLTLIDGAGNESLIFRAAGP